MLLLVLLGSCIFGSSLINGISEHPIFLITAFDGFRYDYIGRNLTPILQELALNGTSAPYITNQFPTITFPNFHSISTGMYPETHGVLGNRAFNEKHECLEYGYELFHYNEDIIPIWNLNELTGGKRYSGVMMWPGSDMMYQNRTATFLQKFDNMTTWESKVDTVVSWILHDVTPANLVLLYFEQPDEYAHGYGPDSPQVNDQLKRINGIVVYLLQKLQTAGIRDNVNLMFLADHGAVPVYPNTTLNLDDYLDPNKYKHCGTSPGWQILPNPGFENEVYQNLTKAEKTANAFKVYKTEDLPDRWHFKNNKRHTSIYIEANLEYIFQDAAGLKGDHGYDNKFLEMYPIFIVQGPLFPGDLIIKPFPNINIYSYLALVLQLISPPPNVRPNGTAHSLQRMLNPNFIKVKDRKKFYSYTVLN